MLYAIGGLLVALALLFGCVFLGWDLDPRHIPWPPRIEWGQTPEHSGNVPEGYVVIVNAEGTPVLATPTPTPPPTPTPVPRRDADATIGTETFPPLEVEEDEVLIVGGKSVSVNNEKLGTPENGVLAAYDDATEYDLTVTTGGYEIVSEGEARTTFCAWYTRFTEEGVITEENVHGLPNWGDIISCNDG